MRYTYKYQVKVDDRVLFDNTCGFIDTMAKVKTIGVVKSIDDDDNILVEFVTETNEVI
jgi:hypothetical protein